MAGAAMEDRILQDQRRVLDAADRLKSVLENKASAASDILAKERWHFASVLMQHLALNERHIYARLDQDPRADVKAFFGGFKGALQQCFDAYTAHMERWTTAQAQGDWSAYRASAVAVVDRFVEHLRREEISLLPFVRKYGIDISAPTAVTSNWVRSAFAIKDSVEDR